MTDLLLPPYLPRLSPDISVRDEKGIISGNLIEAQITELASASGVQARTVRRYVRRARYPLRFLHHLNDIADVDVMASLQNSGVCCFSKWKDVRLPDRLTPRLAYLVGYLQGDGCIESNGKRICFCDEYEDQLHLINRILQDIFGLRGSLYYHHNDLSIKGSYTLEVGSKVLNSFFHHAFGIIRGSKDELSIPVPILGNDLVLRHYVAGLYDADGTLPKDPSTCKQYFVDITLRNKGLILQLRKHLSQFGISTLKPYCRVATSPNSDTISHTWELRIRRKAQIVRFLKHIPLAHPDKKRRKDELLHLMDP